MRKDQAKQKSRRLTGVPGNKPAAVARTATKQSVLPSSKKPIAKTATDIRSRGDVSDTEASCPLTDAGVDWTSKQCAAFAHWLNYKFQPIEEGSVRSGFRTVLIHRRLEQYRLKASEMYCGQQMAKVKSIVQAEIGRGRLAIRADRDVYADLTLREQISSLLLSYTTPWLRLGLEVMFGYAIDCEEDLSGDETSQSVSSLWKSFCECVAFVSLSES